MALAQRCRRSGATTRFGKRSPAEAVEVEVSIPAHFRCPISLDLMKDPVIVPTGVTYDRHSIEKWLEMGNQTCPVTNQAIETEELIPNHSIRRMIQDWCVANRSHGIERIPTPRIPITKAQASDILSEIACMSRGGDRDRTHVHELAARLKALAMESERNRRCFVLAGAARVLADTFSLIASESQGSTVGPLQGILSALRVVLPLDEEACWLLASPQSLASIASILNCGSLEGRLNAVLVLRELVSLYRGNATFIAETEGLIEVLVKLIKEPISPQATKASLASIFYLVCSNEKTAARFVDMELVSLLLEILVENSDKSMSEKALAVLDSILSCERGREKAYGHALTIPLLVKKMFRVSDMTTEFVVSALWKLCKNSEKDEEEGEEGCVVEALRVGAFQKLLLLLQVGSSGSTKDKATELLKLLNASRGKLECIDSIDFKGLNRPLMR